MEGAQRWSVSITCAPETVKAMTADYLTEQDLLGQWLDERCVRDAKASERSGDLHRNYAAWCEDQGARPKSNLVLSQYLRSAGFDKAATMIGKVFYGIKLKPVP